MLHAELLKVLLFYLKSPDSIPGFDSLENDFSQAVKVLHHHCQTADVIYPGYYKRSWRHC